MEVYGGSKKVKKDKKKQTHVNKNKQQENADKDAPPKKKYKPYKGKPNSRLNGLKGGRPIHQASICKMIIQQVYQIQQKMMRLQSIDARLT